MATSHKNHSTFRGLHLFVAFLALALLPIAALAAGLPTEYAPTFVVPSEPGSPEVSALFGWSAAHDISDSARDSTYPCAAVDPTTGAVHVVWQQDIDGSTDIFHTFQLPGQPWTVPENVSNTEGNSELPSLAIDFTGTLHLVWQDNTRRNWDIYYAALSPGGAWTPGLDISQAALTAVSPDIAIGPDNSVHVVWASSGTTNWEIYYVGKQAGAAWTGRLNISNTGGDSEDPVIAVDTIRRLHVAWRDRVSGNYEILYARKPVGQPWDLPSTVSFSTGVSTKPAIAIGPGDYPHVVWVDDSSGNWEILYSMRSGSGPWQAYVNISNTYGGSHCPVILFDSTMAAHVMWYDYSSNSNDILYTYRKPGELWVAPENVSHSDSGSTNPSAAIDAAGYLHVAWEDDRSARLDIYYSRHEGSLVTPTPGMPTPTSTATPGPSPTPTQTSTPAPTATPTFTNTPQPSPTPTISLTPTPRSYRVTLQEGIDGYSGTTDTYVDAWSRDTNFGHYRELAVRQGDVQATLIRFNLADAFSSPNVDVHEAVLSLYSWKRTNSNPLSLSAYRVRRWWREAEATWDDARDGVPWSEGGCNGVSVSPDRDDTALSTITVDDLGIWYDIDITEAVHAWAQDQSANFGVVMKGSGLVQVRYDFASTEYPMAEYHPILRIIYSVRYATLTPPPTYTPQPTYTAEPTHTLLPTYTVEPTYTPQPTHTGQPTYTPRPTYTVEPSITPTVTNTPTFGYLPIILK